MACKRKYFYWLLLSCVVLTLFSGCATHTAITKKIIDNITKPEVNKKPEDLQYFISKKIILELQDAPPNYTVDKAGKLIVTNWDVRRKVTIAKRKKGKLQKIDENGYLVVGFENNHQDCLIKFAQLGKSERYYLIYDDDQKYTIKYGDKEKYGGKEYEDLKYNVMFEGNREDLNDRPYLEIKKKDSPENDKTSRRAKGWKVNE